MLSDSLLSLPAQFTADGVFFPSLLHMQSNISKHFKNVEIMSLAVRLRIQTCLLRHCSNSASQSNSDRFAAQRKSRPLRNHTLHSSKSETDALAQAHSLHPDYSSFLLLALQQTFDVQARNDRPDLKHSRKECSRSILS